LQTNLPDRILDCKSQKSPTGVLFWYWDRREEYDEDVGDNHAWAFVRGARAMTRHAFPFMGWMRTTAGETFSIREVSPYKAAYDIYSITKLSDYESLCEVWGGILASAHARGSGSSPHASDNLAKRIVDKVNRQEDDFYNDVWDIAISSSEEVYKDFLLFRNQLKKNRIKCNATMTARI
jgi:hypothetical protein